MESHNSLDPSTQKQSFDHLFMFNADTPRESIQYSMRDPWLDKKYNVQGGFRDIAQVTSDSGRYCVCTSRAVREAESPNEVLQQWLRVLQSQCDLASVTPFVQSVLAARAIRRIVVVFTPMPAHMYLSDLKRTLVHLSHSTIRYYSSCLLLALEFLRHRQLIHGNLTLSSVALDQHGRPQLTDFDAALGASSNAAAPYLLEHGHRLEAFRFAAMIGLLHCDNVRHFSVSHMHSTSDDEARKDVFSGVCFKCRLSDGCAESRRCECGVFCSLVQFIMRRVVTRAGLWKLRHHLTGHWHEADLRYDWGPCHRDKFSVAIESQNPHQPVQPLEVSEERLKDLLSHIGNKAPQDDAKEEEEGDTDGFNTEAEHWARMAQSRRVSAEASSGTKQVALLEPNEQQQEQQQEEQQEQQQEQQQEEQQEQQQEEQQEQQQEQQEQQQEQQEQQQEEAGSDATQKSHEPGGERLAAVRKTLDSIWSSAEQLGLERNKEQQAGTSEPGESSAKQQGEQAAQESPGQPEQRMWRSSDPLQLSDSSHNPEKLRLSMVVEEEATMQSSNRTYTPTEWDGFDARSQLLARDPFEFNGYQQIMRHAYFRSTNWLALEAAPCPESFWYVHGLLMQGYNRAVGPGQTPESVRESDESNDEAVEGAFSHRSRILYGQFG